MDHNRELIQAVQQSALVTALASGNGDAIVLAVAMIQGDQEAIDRAVNAASANWITF